MLKTFTAVIESKLPFVTPPAAIIGIVKSASSLQPNWISRFKVIDIQATETTPQRVTVIFTEEIAESINARPQPLISAARAQTLSTVSDQIEPIELNNPQAVIGITTAAVFIAAIVGALGLFFLVSLEEVGPLVKEVATQTGSAVRFSAVAIVAVILGFAFIQLR